MVGIYVARLASLALVRSFRVMVHPVPPVLDATRHIVKLFNTSLRKAVQAKPSLY